MSLSRFTTDTLHHFLALTSAPLNPDRSEDDRVRQWSAVAAITDELLSRGESVGV